VILEDALALQEAGVFCLVLESVTAEAAKYITAKLRIPTLGAGSGPYVDGQSLNLYDILGLSLGVVPRFAKKYLNLAEDITRVLGEFKGEVDSGKFPAEENFFRMEEREIPKLFKSKKKS
jgi:3-methyl-2-oxobutanoate hydroxymethyltransferase